jgi:signal peptidase I
MSQSPPQARRYRRSNERPSALARLLNLAVTIILTLLFALFLRLFVVEFYVVEQGSMETTLEPGQIVLVDKIGAAIWPYQTGDIVVFNPPPGLADVPAGIPFVKRIIAFGGSTVTLLPGNEIAVDGRVLVEPYVNSPSGTQPVVGGVTSWKVPTGDVFVLGDHRNVSKDSRAFGPIPMSSILGRVYLRAWPDPGLVTDTPPWNN